VRIVNYHPRARVGDGGISSSVRRLSEAFARVGADPVIAYDGRGAPSRRAGVQWWPIPHRGGGRLRVPVGDAGVLAQADVVVLNSAWTPSNVRFGAFTRRAGVPYVLAPRGAYDPLILGRRRWTKRSWWALFERRLVEGAAAVHVFFPSQQQHLIDLGFRGPVLVAPNGVAVAGGERWDGGSGGYVLYLGRFDPEHKGLDLLLEAVARLPERERPALRLHGPDWRGGKERVEALVTRLGVADHVSVGPPVHDEAKTTLLARSRGFVYPSRWEGFGNSLAEAAAVGVPTLATPYPLARHLADRGACIVVDADPDALADGLRRLLDYVPPPDEGATAAPLAELFDWETVARAWIAQLEPLIGPHLLQGGGHRDRGADDGR
jgi:glycosyltransferase involved in cell wall biosynthesis